MKPEIKAILEDLGFKEGKNKQFIKEKENGLVLGVNFNKHPEKGNPFAVQNGGFFDDLTGIPELEEFVKRRDEILQSLGNGNKESYQGNSSVSDDIKQQGTTETTSSLDVGQKEETILNNHTPTPSPSGVKNPPAPTSNLLKVIREDYEADILEIFGDSGACKTKLAVYLALEARTQGLRVKFIDTERNLRKAEITNLGDSYQYMPGISELNSFCKNLPKGVDVIVIDSIGYPILTDFAKMGVKEKGTSLLQLISWFGDLKDWAINNNKLVIVTNQPDSDFGKEKDYVNKPFGDKARFAAKEIWELKRLGMKQGVTTSNILTFRSRIKGYGLAVAQIEVSDQGTKIKGI